MKKYLEIFRISWQDAFVYRLNFIMWRVRTIFWFLTVYFFWLAVYSKNSSIYNYDRSLMFTYIVGSAFLHSLIFASKSVNIGVEIANGDLNNYLLKPINYLKNWFTKDLADKLLNVIFFILELLLIMLILKPPLIFPSSFLQISLFILSILLAMVLYFFFSFIVSTFAFWYPEHNNWPLRWVVIVIIGFLAGDSLPLDIFPKPIFHIFKLLPFSYMTFYPLQLYLGRLSGSQIINMFMAMIIWLFVFIVLSRFIWKKGLKKYGAYGR